MIELVFRIYTEPVSKIGANPEDSELPPDFTGIVIKEHTSVRSKESDISVVEETVIDYIMPRISRVLNCMANGNPAVVVVFSPDCEQQMGTLVESIIIDSAITAGLSKGLERKGSGKVM